MSNWWDAAPLASGLDARSRDMAIRTIYGEAANEPDDGKAAVGHVIRNRVQAGNYGGQDVPSVVLAPNQFEPWNRPDARARMAALKRDDPHYQGIGSLVDQVFAGQRPDPTGGATHFFAPEAQAQMGRAAPKWAAGAPLAAIGGHQFYSPDKPVSKWWEAAPLVGETAPLTPVEKQDLPPIQTPAQFMPPTESMRERREGVAPVAREVGRGEALLNGAARGVTANFVDELQGIDAASGMPGVNVLGVPVSHMVGAARLGIDAMTGSDEAKKRYTAARDAERETARLADEQQPGWAMGGQVAGAVMMPGGAAMRGANMTARVANSARVGLGYGALAGAGEGQGSADTVEKAAIGGATGAVVGAAAPPVLGGVEKVAGAIGSAVRPIASGIRGARDVDAEASRRVVDAIRKDTEAGRAGLAPAEFEAARASGTPAAVIDLGGENTRTLARSSANSSPTAKAALENLTNDRFKEQSPRVAAVLRDLVPTPGNAAQSREVLQGEARRVNAPLYNAAYKAGEDGINSPTLVRLMNDAPIMETVQKEALASLGNKTAVGRASQMNPHGPNGPTLEFWDQVKRSLDSKINVAKRQGDFEAVGDMSAIRSKLIGELDQAVPEYKAARGVAASFFKADDALDAGEKFVMQNYKTADVRKALAKMSSEEKSMFAEGFVSRYAEKLGATGDRRSILNQINNTPGAREKIELVLGKDKAAELEAAMRVEGIMDKARGAVSGNSSTAAQLIAAGMAGGIGNTFFGTGDFMHGAGAGAALRGGTKFMGQRIDKNVAEKVGELLASNDTAQLAKGLKIVSRSPALMQALRNADDSIARIGAQKSPALPIQIPGLGRAEDQQDVPRP